MDIYQNRELLRLVAIMRGISLAEALDVAPVFIEAGIRAIEVTFNTPGVAEIIHELNTRFGDKLVVGAGTVMTPKDVIIAKDAGASFILSPDCDVDVIRKTKLEGLLSIPGAFTASEVAQADKAGADMVKLFPAGRLGPAYMKDILGPLNNIQFMAVGGVDHLNAKSFLDAGAVAVGIGSSLVNMSLIREKKYAELAELAEKYVKSIN